MGTAEVGTDVVGLADGRALVGTFVGALVGAMVGAGVGDAEGSGGMTSRPDICGAHSTAQHSTASRPSRPHSSTLPLTTHTPRHTLRQAVRESTCGLSTFARKERVRLPLALTVTFGKVKMMAAGTACVENMEDRCL